MTKLDSIRGFALLTLTLPLAVACAPADEASQPPPPIAMAMDAGVRDAAMPPIVEEPSVRAPGAPRIVRPLANAEVANPLLIAGSGEAGAQVRASLGAGDEDLGSASGVIGVDGAFSLRIVYREPADRAAMVLRVIQSNSGGDSEAAEVALVHHPRTLRGTVSQEEGPFDGAAVFVRLYDRADAVVDPVAELELEVDEGQPVDGASFSFRVADGEYYVRAYRDAHGVNRSAPDRRPTVPFDAQSSLSPAIQIAGSDSGDHTLMLNVAKGVEAQFERFDVYTEHDSFEGRTPYHYDEQSGTWQRGSGKCGGYFLRMSVERSPTMGGSSPMVRMPSGAIVALLDDGGCQEIGDNSASSYDDWSGDGRLSFGVANPGADAAGEYVFFYRDPANDFIHEAVDHVASIKKLDRNFAMTSPTGREVASLRPTFEWPAVMGAAAYRLRVEGAQGELVFQSDVVSLPRFAAPDALPDDSFFRTIVEVYDADPGSSDVDARARSVVSAFITDEGRDSSIVVSGNIQNNSGASAPILVYAEGEGHLHASVALPAGSTTYSIRMLASSFARITAFIDVDRAGEPEAPTTKMYESAHELDGTADAALNISFNAPLLLQSPANGATQMGATPKLEWSDYSSHAPSGPWSYAVFATHEGADGFPAIVWGLPNPRNSYDFASPPAGGERFDVGYMASCFMSGGHFVGGVCQGGSPAESASSLAGHREWRWGVVVVQCDFDDYMSSMDRDSSGMNDYAECVLNVLASEDGTYAQSPEWSFFID